jgi:SagB-type dehydrogenase family enzyme
MKKAILIIAIIIITSWGFCQAQILETIKLPEVNKTGGMSLMEALNRRQSDRSFSGRDLTQQQLSDMLWAAYGINRPNGYRTAPSAKAYHEFEIYIIREEGWYIYEPVEHALRKMGTDDLRSYAGTQEFVKTAPVNLVFVADFDRMPNSDDESRKLSSAYNVGFISQNVYLYCAANELATVIRGMPSNPKAAEALQLRPSQHIILAQTVGYRGD